MKGTTSQVDNLKQFILDNPHCILKARLFCMGRELKDGCSIKRTLISLLLTAEMKLPYFPDVPTPIQFMLKADPVAIPPKNSEVFRTLSSLERDKCYMCFNAALFNCSIQ